MSIEQRINRLRTAQKRHVPHFRQSPMSHRHTDKRCRPVYRTDNPLPKNGKAGWGIKFRGVLRSPMCDQQTSIQPREGPFPVLVP